ncbi:MAG: poly-gamma-glutamate system protein, partial [Bacteroidales bacterium]|nr:poly-gamma-glutamate system protein [Bacteroidales bacterium]
MSLTYNLTYIRHRFLLIHGIISLAYVSLYIVLVSQGYTVVKDAEAEKAALRMEESIQVVAAYCRQQHIQVNSVDDPLQTGLVGPEWSSITTTVGHLEAKRTTLNPGFASLVVSMLKKAGVQHGDQIAIGCSGSFPALLIASLSAAEAMDLQVRLIFSLGSSSYGATRPGFNLLHIFQLLKNHQFTSVQPLAISPGGDHDTGLDLEPETVDHIISQIRAFGYPLLFESDLQKNLAK